MIIPRLVILIFALILFCAFCNWVYPSIRDEIKYSGTHYSMKIRCHNCKRATKMYIPNGTSFIDFLPEPCSICRIKGVR